MDLDVLFVGTAGSAPTAGRGLPSTLVRRGGERLLFDCGEGTQRQLLRSTVGLVDLREIFLTHFHVDHWLGLLGMVKTFDLRDRQKPLVVYGPTGLKSLMVRADGRQIAVIHDAGPFTRRLERMRARFPDADAVVFGHSHIPLHEERDGFQIFNPGSPTDRRRQPRHTMGLARLERGRLAFEHVVLD